MSYSRWSESDWYVFWDAANSEDTGLNQALAVWTADVMKTWMYQELKEFDHYDDSLLITSICLVYNCSRESAAECMGYMRTWMYEVEEDYHHLLYGEE
jgi:hypothetical protein